LFNALHLRNSTYNQMLNNVKDKINCKVSGLVWNNLIHNEPNILQQMGLSLWILNF